MQLAIKARMKRVSNKLCPTLEKVMKTSAHGSIVECRDDEQPLQFCVVFWKELYGLAGHNFTLAYAFAGEHLNGCTTNQVNDDK